MDFFLFVIAIAALGIASMALWGVRLLTQRYEAFRAQAIGMLGAHQNYLAGHEDRISTLGARGNPIPTAEELMEGQWKR